MKILFFLLAILIAAVNINADTFWLGADVSGTSELERRGVQLYNATGQPRDNFSLMKELGMNAIRLRVWVNPKFDECSPADVAQMAQRAHDLGLAIMIDFHYSDWWADPGKQFIPEQWKDFSFEQMCNAVAQHTAYTLKLIKERGIDVTWIQIGNETTNGFLWPMGNAHDNMRQYAGLTEAGYQAAKNVYPDAICIVHIDCGSDINRYNYIFDGLKQYGAHWDMIGMSVYPYWDLKEHLTESEDETLSKVIANIKTLNKKYGTPLMIVETGYDVMCPNQGKLFMQRLISQAYSNTDGACRGVFYWAPEAEGQYPLGAFHDRRPTIILDPFDTRLLK